MTNRPPRLPAVVVIASMFAFFVIALLIAAALCWLAWVLYERAFTGGWTQGGLHLAALATPLVVAAGTIVWSLLPRRDRFVPPGPELSERDAPGLFREIQRIAAATGQAPPGHVYASLGVEAFVTERGGVMGFGSTRVLAVGLALLELLSETEAAAVLAHEFGHFHAGDTKLGPWVLGTRASIGRTIENLGRVGDLEMDLWIVRRMLALVRGLRAPFEWFWRLHLRITRGIARAQEYAADAVAARVVGPQALAEALKKTRVGSLAFDAYLHTSVLPVLEAGFRPRITEGFRAFLRAQRQGPALDLALHEALHDHSGTPDDSHPPIPDRLAALAKLSGPQPPFDSRPAIAWLEDVASLEARIIVSRPDGTALQDVAWTDVMMRALAPVWRDRLAQDQRVLSGLTPALVVLQPANMRRRVRALVGGIIDGAPDDEVAARFAEVVGAAVVLALVDRGWTAIAVTGEGIRVERDGVVVEPFEEVALALQGEAEAAAWRARVEALGIAEVALDRVVDGPRRARARHAQTTRARRGAR
ncbi:MAG: M48 family metalloprotease [Nannocystaceae bacterium]|nr:M48 family metalloprotease [Nannocystaceae bacterium]